MLLYDHLQEKRVLLDQYLNQLILETKETKAPYRNLFSAARYSLLSGGKRLRPILLMATAEAYGAAVDQTLSAASAIEMIHTYSLIHDDLPCMDNDDFRRGKPSLHRAYSESVAVLTGDYLLTFAFELIVNDSFLEADKKVQLVALLAQASGGDGMIGGQVVDIQAAGRPLDLEALQQMHQLKTGSLITAAILMGAIIGGAGQQDLAALRSYGYDIGLAFQIIDDILDVDSSFEKHGKATSSDVINQKTTYVSLLGVDKSREEAEKLVASAQKKLGTLGVPATRLHELAESILDSTPKSV